MRWLAPRSKPCLVIRVLRCLRVPRIRELRRAALRRAPSRRGFLGGARVCGVPRRRLARGAGRGLHHCPAGVPVRAGLVRGVRRAACVRRAPTLSAALLWLWPLAAPRRAHRLTARRPGGRRAGGRRPGSRGLARLPYRALRQRFLGLGGRGGGRGRGRRARALVGRARLGHSELGQTRPHGRRRSRTPAPPPPPSFSLSLSRSPNLSLNLSNSPPSCPWAS